MEMGSEVFEATNHDVVSIPDVKLPRFAIVCVGWTTRADDHGAGREGVGHCLVVETTVVDGIEAFSDARAQCLQDSGFEKGRHVFRL